MKVKNGKVEFYRFLFCVIVLLFHCGKYFYGNVSFANGVHLSFFGHGSIGVEFFFVLSGFLMKKTISKNKDTIINEKMLSMESLQFLKRKYMSIFPYHALAFVITVICYLIKCNFGAKESLLYILGSLPNFFLIEMSGIRFYDPNHIEWYISCMMLAMAILYPLCRKHYYFFSRCVAPLLAIFIYGYLIHTTRCICGVNEWTGICYKSFLRSVAGISLGTVSFDISEYLSEKNFLLRSKIWLTVAEWLILAVTVLFCFVTFPLRYEVYMPICFVLLVALAFSGSTYGKKVFNNSFFYHLGKISLPIYLSQLAAIYLVKALFSSVCTKTQQVLLTIAITIIISYLILALYYLIHSIYNKTKTST